LLKDFIAQVSAAAQQLSYSLPKLYPLSNHLTYETLDDSYKAFMASVDGTHDPVIYSEAVKDPRWCDAMNLELRALEENDTWDITTLYCHLPIKLLDVNGYIEPNSILMVLWKDTRLGLLFSIAKSNMVLITKRPLFL